MPLALDYHLKRGTSHSLRCQLTNHPFPCLVHTRPLPTLFLKIRHNDFWSIHARLQYGPRCLRHDWSSQAPAATYTVINTHHLDGFISVASQPCCLTHRSGVNLQSVDLLRTYTFEMYKSNYILIFWIWELSLWLYHIRWSLFDLPPPHPWTIEIIPCFPAAISGRQWQQLSKPAPNSNTALLFFILSFSVSDFSTYGTNRTAFIHRWEVSTPHFSLSAF